MKRNASKVKISPNEMSKFSPKAILEKANIDWNSVESIDPDAFAVSENLAETWRERMEPEEWESKGPNIDPELEDDTVTIASDQIIMSDPSAKAPQDSPEELPEVTEADEVDIDEDSLSIETKLPPENEGHSGGGGMIPGMSTHSMIRGEAKSSNPQTSYSPGKTRDYSFNEWLDFEEAVSASGSSGSLMGSPKSKKK